MVNKILSTSQKLFLHPQKNILSAAAVITAASMLSSLLGLWRNRLLVTHFFTSVEMRASLDAYWVAFRLPELVFQLLVIGALSAAYIPVFAQYKKENEQEAFDLTSTMMNLIILVFLVMSVVIFVFAEPFNGMITSENFSLAQIKLAANLSRVMLLAQLFFAVSNFLTGMIQANHRFIIPALSPLLYNVGIILGIVLLAPIMGIYGPAVGVVIGAFLHFLVQVPLAHKLGYRYRPIFNFRHKGVLEIIRLMPPRALAISANQLEVFVTVYFATALSAGSLTIMNLAQQLMSAPIRIFSIPIGQASLPFLAHEAAEGDMANFKKTLMSSMHHVMFLAIPMGVILMILRVPLVRLAYGSGNFPWSATLLTGKTVAILSLSLFATASVHILTRGFYALKNTRVPLYVALVSVLITIGFSFVSVGILKWGVLGLATALSLASVAQFITLMVCLWKSVGGFEWSRLLLTPLKILVVGFITGVFLWVPMRLLDKYIFDTTRTLPLVGLTVITCLIGALVYLSLAALLRIPEVSLYAKMFRKLGNWQETLAESEEVMVQPSQTEEINPV